MTASEPGAYQGFEQGPIRPPSEASSLLLRVTRNCPWNRCRFCPVYKGERFSRRPVEHVLADIDAVAYAVFRLQHREEEASALARERERSFPHLPGQDALAANVAWNWHHSGMSSVFLQDANSLAIRPEDMIRILRHLRDRFPWIERITTYARSRTLARLTPEQLAAMAEAGLNRVHVGFESGADEVLRRIEKGATKAVHAEAGRKVVAAGMELSAYYMPGLGGEDLWRANALETADLMNQVNPHFIRLRSLAVSDYSPLAQDVADGVFRRPSDVIQAQEILLFLESLHGITSAVRSDHILNLFQDLEGQLPEDQERMIAMPRAFLALAPEQQRLYQVGRRFGVFMGLGDMEEAQRRSVAERLVQRLQVDEHNIDQIVDRQVKQFI